jgi:hypothetical protein
MMKRCLMTMCCVALAVSTALGAQKKAVPPPPKPAESGPSLEATMKYIQNKVGDEGRFNFVVHLHDAQSNEEWSNQNTAEINDLRSETGTCRLGLHWKTSVNGKAATDADYWIDLKTVNTIQVLPIEQDLKRVDTSADHPTREYRVEPTFFAVVLNRTHQQHNTLYFQDEDVANRVAKAFVHAVELCGAGEKELF